MKAKNLVLLLLAALVLGGLAYLKAKPKTVAGSSGAAAGDKVLPVLDKPENLNKIADITVRTASATVRVARVNGTWVAPDKFNYPVKFDQISRFLMALSDLKVGQAMAGGDAVLGDLGLSAPEKAGTNAAAAGTWINLKDEKGGVVADLLVGKTRTGKGGGGESPFGPMGGGGFPDGRYVLAGGQPVLVSESLSDLPQGSGDWMEKQIVNVDSWDLVSLKLAQPDGTAVELKKPDGATDWKIDGLKDEEELDTVKSGDLAGVMSYLSFAEVVDPAKPAAELGFEKPAVLTVRSKKGMVYTLKAGNTLTNSGDRYVMVSAGFEPPAAPAATNAAPDATVTNAVAAGSTTNAPVAEKKDPQAEENAKLAADAKTLNEKAGKWVYLVPSAKGDVLKYTRANVVKAKPKPDPAATNAAPTGVSTPFSIGEPPPGAPPAPPAAAK